MLTAFAGKVYNVTDFLDGIDTMFDLHQAAYTCFYDAFYLEHPGEGLTRTSTDDVCHIL